MRLKSTFTFLPDLKVVAIENQYIATIRLTAIQGRMAWARVKGATENALMQLFKNAYMFRPAFMKATPGQKNLKSYYKYLSWIYPIGKALYPSGFCTLKEVGLAMIKVAVKGYSKKILEVKDIVTIAKG